MLGVAATISESNQPIWLSRVKVLTENCLPMSTLVLSNPNAFTKESISYFASKLLTLSNNSTVVLAFFPEPDSN